MYHIRKSKFLNLSKSETHFEEPEESKFLNINIKNSKNENPQILQNPQISLNSQNFPSHHTQISKTPHRNKIFPAFHTDENTLKHLSMFSSNSTSNEISSGKMLTKKLRRIKQLKTLSWNKHSPLAVLKQADKEVKEGEQNVSKKM